MRLAPATHVTRSWTVSSAEQPARRNLPSVTTASVRPNHETQPQRVVSTGLSALVDAEARLDRALADARAEADALRAAAYERAKAAAGTLDSELDRERARAARAIEDATARELRSIADEARLHVARFEAVEGERLRALACELARRLAALALAEAPP